MRGDESPGPAVDRDDEEDAGEDERKGISFALSLPFCAPKRGDVKIPMAADLSLGDSRKDVPFSLGDLFFLFVGAAESAEEEEATVGVFVASDEDEDEEELELLSSSVLSFFSLLGLSEVGSSSLGVAPTDLLTFSSTIRGEDGEEDAGVEQDDPGMTVATER